MIYLTTDTGDKILLSVSGSSYNSIGNIINVLEVNCTDSVTTNIAPLAIQGTCTEGAEVSFSSTVTSNSFSITSQELVNDETLEENSIGQFVAYNRNLIPLNTWRTVVHGLGIANNAITVTCSA